MTEPDARRPYAGEERRRRWPGECTGDERREVLVVVLETDQEPDQSPLGSPGSEAQIPQLSQGTPAAPG
jgi:hypothetical protein